MASQPPSITLRPATLDDVPLMTQIYLNAFEHTTLSRLSFPSHEPQVAAYWADWIQAKINVPDTHMVLALLGRDVVGWARWVRVPAAPLPDPPLVFSAAVYPACGDGALAARFFQAAHNARRRLMGAREHWFLSMIMTRTDAQRNGVGSALMRYGCEKADEDGWQSFLNASRDGRPLYELFGFKSDDITAFDDIGQEMHHMTREPKAKSA
ncbi:acyl-CoA N-acyltransferase [Thelonectria olida]|uniref:Acyl-CoA N-acyltransferase n=1 Tax=Thelonectria olida TaxID=1576542 RepID=A0A9P8W6B8_9HYPO|nr:acyl-CoA N-acyltransferase [Thelonectria olida]